MCYCPTHTLHLNLALTGDGAFLLSPPKMHTVWFISILNYGDTENVLINHLLFVIPMSYPCHYTNLCPHKPHKHAQTHTHTHTHTLTHPHTHTPTYNVYPSLSNTRTCTAFFKSYFTFKYLNTDYFKSSESWIRRKNAFYLIILSSLVMIVFI